MRRILKFVLQPGVTEIATADDPRFLAIGAQGDDVVVWAEASVGGAVRTLVAAVMTGESPPDDAEYIGTVQRGAIVVHAYRQRPRPGIPEDAWPSPGYIVTSTGDGPGTGLE